MAVTISVYDHTAKLFANKEVTFTTLKVKLLNNSATYDKSHTTVSAVDSAGANEVSGNGWASGGPTLANVTVTQVTTNDAKLDADDVDVAASGGPIPSSGQAYKALIYDSTSSKPLAFIDFGRAWDAGDGTHFLIVWAAGGIFSWTNAA
jgi:hypothetical protein